MCLPWERVLFGNVVFVDTCDEPVLLRLFVCLLAVVSNVLFMFFQVEGGVSLCRSFFDRTIKKKKKK